MRTFYTGDTHFGHQNVIAHCDRRDPATGERFGDINRQDAYLIDLWNATVARNDRVIHVGDFAFKCDPKRVRAIFSRLNGQKFLVIGNHDDRTTLELNWAATPQHILNVSDEGQRVVACHYGLRVWPGARRGALHVFGHSHGRLPGNSLSTDVGVDCWDLRPVTLSEIRARLAVSPAPIDGEIADPETDDNDGAKP
ncbi:metallophosphoesterase [Bradyrhizobium japonicum]|uniref:metallophosphoesterase n=1 Tax=Bradyrhizobium japonicum TaxID=375 RepID=UPI0011805ECE|nr:metallophosphoesterase [Bradyrhizobium japonicum]